MQVFHSLYASVNAAPFIGATQGAIHYGSVHTAVFICST